MTGWTARRSFEDCRTEWRRVVIAALLILAAAVVWRFSRPALIRATALSSVGCFGREKLLAAALRQNIPNFPTDRKLFGETSHFQELDLWSHSRPAPGWIWWRGYILLRPYTSGVRGYGLYQQTFADSYLNVKGSLRAGQEMRAAPGDWDSDGNWEVLLEYEAVQDERKWDLTAYAVVRLKPTHNEVLWLGITNRNFWRKPRPSVVPIWCDEDGDGRSELVFVTRGLAGTYPNFRFERPRPVVIFAWDRPGGILLPRSLPEPGGFIFWQPLDGQPLEVEPDMDLIALFRGLLPVTEDFAPLPP